MMTSSIVTSLVGIKGCVNEQRTVVPKLKLKAKKIEGGFNFTSPPPPPILLLSRVNENVY